MKYRVKFKVILSLVLLVSSVIILTSSYPIATYSPVLLPNDVDYKVEKGVLTLSKDSVLIEVQGYATFPYKTQFFSHFQIQITNSSPETLQIRYENLSAAFSGRAITKRIFATESLHDSLRTQLDSIWRINPHSEGYRGVMFTISSADSWKYDKQHVILFSIGRITRIPSGKFLNFQGKFETSKFKWRRRFP